MEQAVYLLAKPTIYQRLHQKHINLVEDIFEEVLFQIQEDLEAFHEKDPSASHSLDTLARTCSSFQAIVHFRIAHCLITDDVSPNTKILNTKLFPKIKNNWYG